MINQGQAPIVKLESIKLIFIRIRVQDVHFRIPNFQPLSNYWGTKCYFSLAIHLTAEKYLHDLPNKNLLPSNLYPPRWFNCNGIDEQLGAEQGSLPFRKKTVLTSDARRGQTFFTSWPTLNTQSVSCVFVLSFKPNHSIAMIWP
jgi:hypothetical protein